MSLLDEQRVFEAEKLIRGVLFLQELPACTAHETAKNTRLVLRTGREPPYCLVLSPYDYPQLKEHLKEMKLYCIPEEIVVTEV